MRSHHARFLALGTAAAVTAALLAGCGGSSGGGGGSKAPITIGASLSLTGDFSGDGQAFEKGYKLWASEVNSHGGLLGRQVRLDIVNDDSCSTTRS